jgi:hypothetical protein
MQDIILRDLTHYKVMTFKSDGVWRRSKRKYQKVGENEVP